MKPSTKRPAKASLRVINVAAIPPDVSTWPTEAEAAAELSTSVRTVRRRAAEGGLGRAKRKSIAGRKPVVVYDPRDIARIKAEQEMAGAQQSNRSQGPGLALVQSAVTASVRELVAPLMEMLDKRLRAATQAPQDAPPLFMTIRAASKWYGLSQAGLRRRIASGELKPVVDGRSTKLRRTDIEKIGATELASKAGR
jgi:hypothetical protein